MGQTQTTGQNAQKVGPGAVATQQEYLQAWSTDIRIVRTTSCIESATVCVSSCMIKELIRVNCACLAYKQT
jgi:hypothetical protein